MGQRVARVPALLLVALFAIPAVILPGLFASCGGQPTMNSNTISANTNVAISANMRGSPSPGSSANTNVATSATPSVSASPSSGTDWEAMIRNEERNLRESKIAFNPPAEMQEQKTETIQARISFEDIGADLGKGLQGSGTPQEAPLKVSEIMKVTLTGDRNAFLIQTIGDEEQVVAGKRYAQWEWHVTPLQPGDQKLNLTATATIFLPGRGEKPIYYKTLEKPIIVHVDRWYTFKQFIANNWQWLWAVVLVPLLGLIWRLIRKSKKSG